MDYLRNLDAFPKYKAKDTRRTTHGACTSIVALLIMFCLFVSEFSYYRTIEVVDRLSVNSTHAQHLVMRFDIVFPHIPCDLLSLDAMDSSGQRQEGIVTHVFKKTIDPITLRKKGEKTKVTELGTLQHEHELGDLGKDGEGGEGGAAVAGGGGGGGGGPGGKCGNCYGAQETPEDCCNTCSEVRDKYRKKGWAFIPENIDQCKGEKVSGLLQGAAAARAGEKGEAAAALGGGARGLAGVARSNEGCEISGDVDLTTVNGNVHFAPGASVTDGARAGTMTVAQLMQFTFETFNITHEIKSLSFGNHFPGITNPLDGQRRGVQDGHGMYQYYLKVVPTVYK